MSLMVMKAYKAGFKADAVGAVPIRPERHPSRASAATWA